MRARDDQALDRGLFRAEPRLRLGAGGTAGFVAFAFGAHTALLFVDAGLAFLVGAAAQRAQILGGDVAGIVIIGFGVAHDCSSAPVHECFNAPEICTARPILASACSGPRASGSMSAMPTNVAPASTNS